MISYDNLWETMKKKGISQYTLIKKYGVSPGQLTRMKRNESVSTHTIEMFCRILAFLLALLPTFAAIGKSRSRRSAKSPFRLAFFPPLWYNILAKSQHFRKELL